MNRKHIHKRNMHMRRGKGFFEDVVGLFGGNVHKNVHQHGGDIMSDVIGGISSIFGGNMLPNIHIDKLKYNENHKPKGSIKGGKIKPLSYKLK